MMKSAHGRIVRILIATIGLTMAAAVPVTAPPTWVFFDGTTAWTDDSFAATANYTDTSGLPRSGKYDISMSVQQWGAWQMTAPNGTISLTPYSAVTFALKPTIANQDWSVEATPASGTPTGINLDILPYGPAPVVGKWAVYTVPLSKLGVAGESISSLAIQDQTGLSSNLWYIDNVGFLRAKGAAPAPVVTVIANPSVIPPGAKSTLTWSSSNSTSCSGNNSLQISATAGSTIVEPAGTTSYTITCTGAGGTGNASAQVTVSTTAAPTVSLTANVTALMSGGTSTLTWSSTNTTTCAPSGWTTSQATSGTQTVTPTTTTTYSLTCTGPNGSVSASATVDVSPAAYWVYQGGVFYWPGDYSYSATINYADTTGDPLTGPYDIEVQTTSFGAWQPYAWNYAFDSSPYTYLTFALKPTVANQTWSCQFIKVGDVPVGISVDVNKYGPAPVVGQWATYTIPLADLGVLGTSIYKFAIQDQTGLATNKWYVDNVGFLTAGGSSSAAPTVTVKANPTSIAAGNSSTLSWSATNATGCALSGFTGRQPTSNALTVTPTSTTTYTLTCAGEASSQSSSATATVLVENPNVFSIQVSGNQLANGAGKAVQLRGVNLSAFEFVAVDGYDPTDPTGGAFGQPYGPNWSAIAAWKANVVRIPLNEDSWLGLTCTDTSGATRNADPGSNYKQFVANFVQQANALGMYVILDLHWAAPGSSCPMLQSQMADSDHSLAFWTSIANTYKNNPAVLFELFNEPYLNFNFTGDPWQYMMFGQNGAFSGYPATGVTNVWQDIMTPWNIASYQAMINAVRATGATNVLLIGSVSYTADLSGWLSHKPSDPLNQIAATWHPYPTYGSTWGTPAWAQPNYSPEIFTEVQNILAAGIPVIATETGDQDTAGTVGAPLVQTITTFADANGVSVLGWTWDVWQDPDFVLIKDVNGTPTDGYGVFFQNWLVNHK